MNKALIEPSSGAGTEITRLNAMKHGILSRFTVLPWEDGNEYQALLTALQVEHMPVGPTEEHLVEELAGILWRKRRLRLAEAAAYNHGLNNAIKPFRETAEAALAHIPGGKGDASAAQAIHSTADKTSADIRDMQEDEAMTLRALEILNSGGNDAYKAAFAALREDTQQWWSELVEGDTDEDEDFNGAQEKTRTSTSFRKLAPEASASTNSATWALCGWFAKGTAAEAGAVIVGWWRCCQLANAGL
jgi:hypothetical protein